MSRISVAHRERHLATPSIPTGWLTTNLESLYSTCRGRATSALETSAVFNIRRLDDHAEAFVAVLYQVTHIGFIIGSLFFLPTLERRTEGMFVGEILFVFSSALLLFINLNDLFEIWKYSSKANNNSEKVSIVALSKTSSAKPVFDPSFVHHSERKSTRYEILAGVMYATGSMLFLVGSIVFIWYGVAGGWLFVVGSVAFVFGAFVNSFQIWDSPDSRSAQMANTVSMLYVTASTLFFAASFPYAYTFHNEEDKTDVLTEAAWAYVLGSALFFVCGLLDIRRSHYVRNQNFFRPCKAECGGENPSAAVGASEQMKSAPETPSLSMDIGEEEA